MFSHFLRLALSLGLLVTAASTASAQAYLRAGVTAGINIANASLDPDFDQVSGASRASRLGPLVGITWEWGVRDVPVAFQPEMHYVEKGAVVTYTAPADGVDSTQDIRYSYLEFPVLARVPLMEGATRVYVVAGPTFGFNFAARGLHESSRGSAEADYYEDITRTDIGIDIGAGAEFELMPGMYLLADVRYTHGLTDITEPIENRPEETWYSRDIKIKTGVKWDLWEGRK